MGGSPTFTKEFVMNILITGYQGFIGSNVFNFLGEKDYTVWGWEWEEGALPNVKRVDRVIHLGAISATTERDVEKVLTQNLEFSLELLKHCQEYGVPMQYASSASVYGVERTVGKSKENDRAYPASPYAWSKYLFDRVVMKNIDNFETPVHGFRYFNVYGPGEEHKGNMMSPVSKFIMQAKDVGHIKLFKDSHLYERDFVCVEDIMDVHERFLNVPDNSGIYNVGTGTPVSFQYVGEQIAERFGVPIEYIDMPDNLKGQYQTYTCADTNKLTWLTGEYDWWTIPKYLDRLEELGQL